ETFSTNLMGTVNLLQACRDCSSVKAIVVVTSDKCYENTLSACAYRETDPLGGYDPYSASKGCTEIIASSYRRSFFSLGQFSKRHTTLLATARAGNVIGGGDWSEDRLIPDIIRASVENKKTVIRNPNSTRPWQHVLESLSGYLLLGQKLLEGNTDFAEAWNFGPGENGSLKVKNIIQKLKEFWPEIDYELSDQNKLHEAALLQLDCSKSRSQLGWHPVWDISKTLEMVAGWYLNFYQHQKIISDEQLQSYVESAKNKNLIWAKL
ncbi:CDP-glucose 4,6-dehydratase, partial [Candidatus Pacearchaeota archaeon]|nr:CDP-glucose 4,6-dehydratase [Candidatus Pacearchaeota archaeon]